MVAESFRFCHLFELYIAVIHEVCYNICDGEFIKEYPNAFLASKETGICYTSIRKCVVGRQETAGSYIWKNKQG